MTNTSDTEQEVATIDEILNNLGATLFCMGQDWTKGDGSASQGRRESCRSQSPATAIICQRIG